MNTEDLMAIYKPYPHDQIVMLPFSLQEQLDPGTLEFTIHELVEEHIDLSIIEARYQNDHSGARAIDPLILLKIILFAYARGIDFIFIDALQAFRCPKANSSSAVHTASSTGFAFMTSAMLIPQTFLPAPCVNDASASPPPHAVSFPWKLVSRLST